MIRLKIRKPLAAMTVALVIVAIWVNVVSGWTSELRLLINVPTALALGLMLPRLVRRRDTFWEELRARCPSCGGSGTISNADTLYMNESCPVCKPEEA